MVAAGVINPDAFNDKASARKQWFNGGIAAFDYDSFVAWNQYYSDNTAGDAFAVNMLDVPGFDGGEGSPWMGSALNNVTSFSKDSKHTAETLLKIANWMAAPFGTEEYLFRKYGVAGRHYTLQGTDPVPTKVGVVETGIGLQYISDSTLALYWAGKPDVPQKQHAIQEKVAERLVYDASYGLYSDTLSKKQPQLAKTMTDLEEPDRAGQEAGVRLDRGGADLEVRGRRQDADRARASAHRHGREVDAPTIQDAIAAAAEPGAAPAPGPGAAAVRAARDRADHRVPLRAAARQRDRVQGLPAVPRASAAATGRAGRTSA